MPFTPEFIPEPFIPSPSPSIEDDPRLYLEREFRSLQFSIESLRNAITELQEKVDSL